MRRFTGDTIEVHADNLLETLSILTNKTNHVNGSRQQARNSKTAWIASLSYERRFNQAYPATRPRPSSWPLLKRSNFSFFKLNSPQRPTDDESEHHNHPLLSVLASSHFLLNHTNSDNKQLFAMFWKSANDIYSIYHTDFCCSRSFGATMAIISLTLRILLYPKKNLETLN